MGQLERPRHVNACLLEIIGAPRLDRALGFGNDLGQFYRYSNSARQWLHRQKHNDAFYRMPFGIFTN